MWQTTHVGGHRYAPNVVYLPGDWFLGFVHADLSVDLVNRLDQGVLDLHHIRGRAGLSPLEQAAEHFARGCLHAVRVDQLQWEDTQWLAEDRLLARFHVSATDTQIELEVTQSLGPAATASCDGPPKPQKAFHLVRLEQVSI